MIDKAAFEILAGLRSPSSSPMEKHGAVVVAKRWTEDAHVKICAFHDGAEIVGLLITPESMHAQLDALKEREWVPMGDSDIYVTSHGMGLPQTPFWAA